MSDQVDIPDTVEALQNEVINVVSIRSGRPPHAGCTCGWKTAPSKELFDLANAAFKHSEETGHQLRHHENT